MTELEFEKACRGSLPPVPFENAWGTNNSAKNIYNISNSALTNEIIAGQLSTYRPIGNVSGLQTNNSGGPYRVGIFAASTTGLSNAGRILSGATYYGIMEMSGNVYERAVTVGAPQGRVFTGSHGCGTLDATGFASNTDWPNPTTAIGMGQRGGSFGSSVAAGNNDSVSVSRRFIAAAINSVRSPYFGGRGVRTAP